MKGAAQKMPLYPVVKMDTQDDREQRQERMQVRAQILVINKEMLDQLDTIQRQISALRKQRKGLKDNSPDAVMLDRQIEAARESMTTETEKANDAIKRVAAIWDLNPAAEGAHD